MHGTILRVLTNIQTCVIPRPIGWISTQSKDGQANLAPYSQFNNLTFDPPYVMYVVFVQPNRRGQPQGHRAQRRDDGRVRLEPGHLGASRGG